MIYRYGAYLIERGEHRNFNMFRGEDYADWWGDNIGVIGRSAGEQYDQEIFSDFIALMRTLRSCDEP